MISIVVFKRKIKRYNKRRILYASFVVLNRFFVKLKLIFFSFVNVAHALNRVAYVLERTGRAIHF